MQGGILGESIAESKLRCPKQQLCNHLLHLDGAVGRQHIHSTRLASDKRVKDEPCSTKVSRSIIHNGGEVAPPFISSGHRCGVELDLLLSTQRGWRVGSDPEAPSRRHCIRLHLDQVTCSLCLCLLLLFLFTSFPSSLSLLKDVHFLCLVPFPHSTSRQAPIPRQSSIPLRPTSGLCYSSAPNIVSQCGRHNHPMGMY